MFEVSWGELVVVVGLGVALIGRKDLPNAARVAGTQVGRVVGFLQGARARADRFAAQNELRQLQNELRSGLRELDAVKSELAVSISGRGMVGRGLGAIVPGVNKNDGSGTPPALGESSTASAGVGTTATLTPKETPGFVGKDNTGFHEVGRAHRAGEPSSTVLPPVSQTIAAVAEEEWEKQGIAFRSRAEQGVGISNFDQSTSTSVLLSNLMKETLIHDQYDRVVQEQDDALQSKVANIKQKLKDEGSTKNGKKRRS